LRAKKNIPRYTETVYIVIKYITGAPKAKNNKRLFRKRRPGESERQTNDAYVCESYRDDGLFAYTPGALASDEIENVIRIGGGGVGREKVTSL